MSKNTKKRSRIFVIIAVFAVLLVAAFFLFSDSDTEDSLALEDIHGISIDINNSDRLYIANHEGLYAYESATGLSSVSDVHADFMSLASHPSDPNILFASGHPEGGGNLGLQKSTNGGQTWEKVSDGLDGPVDFHALGVDSSNPNIISRHWHQRSTKSLYIHLYRHR